MKLFLFVSICFSFSVFAQNSEPQKKVEKTKEVIDYGDKQLHQRDICRRPVEFLETRYGMTKEEIAKAKAKCPY